MSLDQQHNVSSHQSHPDPQDGGYPPLQHQTSRTSIHSNEGRTRREKPTFQHTTNSNIDRSMGTTSPQFNPARQPINEAVSSVFSNNAEAGFSPDLVSQITQNVLQQLKAQNLLSPTTSAAPFSAEQPDTSSSTNGSPPIDRAKMYTPPSPMPYRAGEEAAQTPHSPRLQERTAQTPHARTSPAQRDISPFSHGSHTGSQTAEPEARESKTSRPAAPKRVSTEGDMTLLEKIWGKLFNDQGQSTIRLGQFLRGIAVHLIEDYEPKHSLVITPQKMQKYYEDTKQANEIYPWHVIFDDHTSSISRLFREISVQHHLVQEKLDVRPDIPGLTPQGFETWATLLLRAHPDLEFERLARTALDMPINNPDDLKERFPKELSRRQFPKDGDLKLAATLQKSMAQHCNVTFSRQNSIIEPDSKAPPPVTRTSESTLSQTSSTGHGDKSEPVQTPNSAPPNRQSFSNLERATSAERDRLHSASSTTSKPPSEAAIEEEDSSGAPTPQPIERERKPYVAHPGGGKNYEFAAPPSSDRGDPTTSVANDLKLSRSASVSGASRTKPPPIAIHQKGPPPPDLPDLQRARSNTTYPREPPPRYNRNRSPSLSKGGDPGHKSEADLSFSSYHSTSSYTGDGHRPPYSERYDHRAQSTFDGRESRHPEREARPRFQSTAGHDGHYYSSGDDVYRGNSSHPTMNGNTYPSPATAAYAQYPPNSYRDGR